jgi:hypothetical protein
MSVLVTAFLRRGRPRSGLKLSVRLERQASKDSAAHQKQELRAIGPAWRCSLTGANVSPQLAPPRKNGEPLTSRNRLVSRRRNSVKVVIHTIRGVRGGNPRNELISLGWRDWQDWARLLPSSIAPERQRSARTRRSLRFLFRRALQLSNHPSSKRWVTVYLTARSKAAVEPRLGGSALLIASSISGAALPAFFRRKR